MKGRLVGDTKWVPVRTAKGLLGVSRQRVYAMIKQGLIAAQSIDGAVTVSSTSIRDRIASRQKELEFDGA